MINKPKKAITVLRTGGIVAHATDTCYGFACDIYNKEAVERLYKLKNMPRNKPISILVSDLKMARKFGRINALALKLAGEYWPGALTIIVKRRAALPRYINPGNKTIGIRIPDHKLSLELVKELGGPITTTSANISGKPSPYSVSAIKKQFSSTELKPDFIIDSGRLPGRPSSTVVDLSGKNIKIVRLGDIDLFKRIIFHG